jgi:8-oxo-dGTP diphosphatase
MDAHMLDDRPVIAAAVIVDGGRVLFVRRREAEGKLRWQFPAGQVEAGETWLAAAVRETLEETGLAVTSTAILGDRIHPATGRRMAYVACSVLSGTAHVADPDELDAVEWCAPEQVTQYVPWPFYPPVQAYLDEQLAPVPARP